MADNVQAGTPVGPGPIFKSEDDGVAQWVISKIAWGLAGVRTLIGSGTDALPIQDGGNTITVDGTVTVNTGLTDTQLRASDVKITLDGESVPVTGTFFQGTQPVSGTFFQATQPVSVASLPLPSTASTDANQTTGNSSLTSIDSKMTTGNTSLSSIDGKLPSVLVSDRLQVDGSGVTQPISATTLPLPTLASVASQQGADVVDLATLAKYSLGATAQQLTQTIDGRLRVEVDTSLSSSDRRLQEYHLLELIEQSYRNLASGNGFNSERRGFEMR